MVAAHYKKSIIKNKVLHIPHSFFKKERQYYYEDNDVYHTSAFYTQNFS